MMTFPTEWKVIKFHGSKPPTRYILIPPRRVCNEFSMAMFRFHLTNLILSCDILTCIALAHKQNDKYITQTAFLLTNITQSVVSK